LRVTPLSVSNRRMTSNRFLLIWRKSRNSLILKPDSYPARWKSRVAISRAFGDAWLKAKKTPALLVPTIITPGEWNVLINPLHPQFSLTWIVGGPDAYAFDARLFPIKKKARSARRSSRP
jgi:RES domain-containing protein